LLTGRFFGSAYTARLHPPPPLLLLLLLLLLCVRV